MNPQHTIPTMDDNGFYLWERYGGNFILISWRDRVNVSKIDPSRYTNTATAVLRGYRPIAFFVDLMLYREEKLFGICNYNHTGKNNCSRLWLRKWFFSFLSNCTVTLVIILYACYYYYFTVKNMVENNNITLVRSIIFFFSVYAYRKNCTLYYTDFKFYHRTIYFSQKPNLKT